jgi:protein gp37
MRPENSPKEFPLPKNPLNFLNCVIVGGESGRFARPMKIEWVRKIFRACRSADVPFFFKHWGGIRKHITSRRLNGKTYDEMPQRIAA